MIVQEEDPTITHTWNNFKFSDFSDVRTPSLHRYSRALPSDRHSLPPACAQWVNVFKPGKGTITIWENTGGTRGAQLYQLKGIPLTPGPLVVV
jgi:hypothetical protein